MKKIDKALKDHHSALHSLVVFRRAANTISKQEFEIIKKHGLTVGQFGVMEALYNKGDLRIQDLIEKLLSTSGNMTVVIRNMERDGYVERIPDPFDRRACRVHLTPMGHNIIEKILPEHYDNIGQIFSVLTPAEQEQLAALLKKFKP